MCPETFHSWVTIERVHYSKWSKCPPCNNVWAGIVGDCLVGSHLLPHRVTGNHYQDFLSYDLPKILEVVPLAVRARMWYMHDGAPTHFSRAVRDVLSKTCHERMRRSMLRHVEACTESHGGHFEHLLKMYSSSFNSKMKCFRTRWCEQFFLFWYVELVPKVSPHLSITSCTMYD
jgi:hypothetical protein